MAHIMAIKYIIAPELNGRPIEFTKNNSKFSSTEGYFGEGPYDKESKYKLYNREHFFKILKKKYRKTNYIKSGLFPTYWNYDFLKIHNCVIKSR